jgi:hypothetical protein
MNMVGDTVNVVPTLALPVLYLLHQHMEVAKLN